jgi:hypothetical protein
MAVTSVNKVRIVESADTTYDGSSYEVLYLVKVDDIDTALVDILNATGIPAFGDEFDEIEGAYCTGKSADLVGSSRSVWQVTVVFDNSEDSGVIDGTDTATYTWGTETIRRTFTIDLDENPVVNTAGDPFVPAAETDLHLTTLRVEREEDTFSGTTIEAYVNSLNSIDVVVSGYTIAAKTGLMKKVGASYDPAKDKWKVTYDITIKKPDLAWASNRPAQAKPNVPAAENAWLKRILNAGLRQLDPVDNKVKPIIDPESRKDITQPLPLYFDGSHIPPAVVAGGFADWLGFREYEAVDWNPLTL